MEKDKPVFSRHISAGTRVYYFDLYKDSKGQPYMAFSEIPTDKAPKNKKRQRIFLHSEKMEEFAQVFAEVARQIKIEGESVRTSTSMPRGSGSNVSKS